jgi:electron transport complex protein RnfC
LARERNEFRLMRIEREKQERAQKHAQKAVGAQTEAAKEAPAASANSEADAAKKAAIAAAIERAKAQKAAAAPQNIEKVEPAIQAEIAKIDARRDAAKQAVQAQLFESDPQDNK